MVSGSQSLPSELNSGEDFQADEYCVQFRLSRKNHPYADVRWNGTVCLDSFATAGIMLNNCITSHDVNWTEGSG